VIDHAVVEIFTSQVSVASSRLDFKDTILDGQDGDVEGAAAQIEDEDVGLLALALLLVKAVCDGGSGGLVDDTEDI